MYVYNLYLLSNSIFYCQDPNYIFRLYMALGNFKQAARTAVIIAKQEQEEGNYKVCVCVRARACGLAGGRACSVAHV